MAHNAFQAGGDEILVSGLLRELVTGQDFAFHDLGERALKGFGSLSESGPRAEPGQTRPFRLPGTFAIPHPWLAVQSPNIPAPTRSATRMSNVDAVKALLTAIRLDRFADIEAAHLPGATLWPFATPPARGSVAIQDWYTEFLRGYADCHYADAEFVEDGDTVAVRATIEAKGYNWREFSQRVVDVCEMQDGLVAGRRLYAMLPDLELDKPATAAMNNAIGYRGGSTGDTRKAVDGFYGALLSGNTDGAKAHLSGKSALIDSVNGVVTGPDAIVDLLAKMPRPAFGAWRVTRTLCGAKDAVVELAIDPARPRAADWVRMVDGQVAVIERHWMLREIGIAHDSEKRHLRRVIHPM